MSDEYIPMPKNPKRQYSGEYVGIVETGEHDEFMRVQVRVKEIFTDDVPAAALPWATYRLPPGSRINDGFFTPVKAGDYVWIDFPFAADTRRPRITGGVHYCPKEKPAFPAEAYDPTSDGACTPFRTGLPDAVDRTPVKPDQPPCVFKQNGACIEMLRDGTVRVTNIASGSNIEISQDGQIIIHAEKALYLSSKENQETAIHGDRDITVMGDIVQNAQSDVTETTKGEHNISGMKGVTITSDAKITIKAPLVEIN